MADVPIAAGAPDMEGRLDQLRRWLAGPPFWTTREGLWHPAVDIHERDGEIVVEVEIPGMKGEQIDVSIERRHLLVEGSRPASSVAEEGEARYRERPVGRFHRVVHLPGPVDADAASATYEDGVLTVVLPLAAGGEGRRIEIR